jgi:hypothetical protein
VCWSTDNSGRTAGIRDATEDIGEEENRGGSPAGPPSASVKYRSHPTMMACPRSNRCLPSLWRGWADVYDDDHEEMQACEANPDPGSALGLCPEHAVSRLQYLVN